MAISDTDKIGNDESSDPVALARGTSSPFLIGRGLEQQRAAQCGPAASKAVPHRFDLSNSASVPIGVGLFQVANLPACEARRVQSPFDMPSFVEQVPSWVHVACGPLFQPCDE